MSDNSLKFNVTGLSSKDFFDGYSLSNELILITKFSNGHYSNTDNTQHGLHTHDFYVLTWVESGSFDYKLDMDNYRIRNNTLLLLSPGEIHSHYSSSGISGTSIFFTKNYFSLLPNSWSNFIKHNLMRNYPFIELKSSESQNRFKMALSILQKEYDCFLNSHNHIGVYSALTLLLYGIYETPEFKLLTPRLEKAQSSSILFYFSFIDKLESQYSQYHSVQHYAEELGISVNKLEKYCRQCSGKKPSEIICNRIMLEAKRLLLFTQLRSKEISHNLGFIEQCHFVNYFKKNANVSPTKFRKEYGTKVFSTR